MRRLKHGCGVVAQNFLLNYSLFKITLNPSKKVEFSLENQKDMSVDGNWYIKTAEIGCFDEKLREDPCLPSFCNH